MPSLCISMRLFHTQTFVSSIEFLCREYRKKQRWIEDDDDNGNGIRQRCVECMSTLWFCILCMRHTIYAETHSQTFITIGDAQITPLLLLPLSLPPHRIVCNVQIDEYYRGIARNLNFLFNKVHGLLNSHHFDRFWRRMISSQWYSKFKLHLSYANSLRFNCIFLIDKTKIYKRIIQLIGERLLNLIGNPITVKIKDHRQNTATTAAPWCCYSCCCYSLLLAIYTTNIHQKLFWMGECCNMHTYRHTKHC